MMLRVLVLFAALSVFAPITVLSEPHPIELVVLNHGYSEVVDLCTFKHHGSYDVVAPAYSEWYTANKEAINLAQKALEEEAADDPIKAKKLPQVERFSREQFRQLFLKIPAEETALLCFDKDVFLQMFDSEKRSRH